jgi:hypothetical protein
MIIPLVITDLCAEIYHRISFPLYGIPYVRRSKYIIIDRHRLQYLSFFQKLGCVYCGYANGLIAYVERIAGDTENYWCGIKHKYNTDDFFQPHQKNFLNYDDPEKFDEMVKKPSIKNRGLKNL